MVSFVKKFSGIGVSEIWFAERRSFKDSFSLAAYMHLKKKAGSMLAAKNITYTVENNLLPTEAELFNSFSKTVQIEIKQAEKYGVKCFFTNDIDEFESFYNLFAESRKIDYTSKKRLNEMKAHLKLTKAEYNGSIVAAHSYLVDEEYGIVRLMHAASQRLNPDFDKQLAGRANKLLHYFDMLDFKKKGFSIYDFGGYAKDTEDKGLQGINNFKCSFGGTVTPCFNYLSYPYYLLKKLAAATGRLGQA